MTEGEWLKCTNPVPMLSFLGHKLSIRKRRLFAVACCRRIWHMLVDARSRAAVSFAERLLDEDFDLRTRLACVNDADDAARQFRRRELGPNDTKHRMFTRAAGAASACLCMSQELGDNASRAAAEAVAHSKLARSRRTPCRIDERLGDAVLAMRYAAFEERPAFQKAMAPEQKVQAALLREIVGNLFRPVAVDPIWLKRNKGRVAKLAQAIHEKQALDRMSELGHALEKAGCTDAEFLKHCRKKRGHVRGCWAIDLLLGKAPVLVPTEFPLEPTETVPPEPKEINLHSESATRFAFSGLGWSVALNLAERHGWKPRGTEAPEGLDEWEGDYGETWGQRVTALDARALARALDAALASPNVERVVARMAPNPRQAKFPTATLAAAAVGVADFEEYRRDLRHFSQFCRRGAFRIG